MTASAYMTDVARAWGRPDLWDLGGATFTTAEQAFREFGVLIRLSKMGVLTVGEIGRMESVAHYFSTATARVSDAVAAISGSPSSADEAAYKRLILKTSSESARFLQEVRHIAEMAAVADPAAGQRLVHAGAWLAKLGGGLLSITQVGLAYADDGAEAGAKKLVGALGGMAVTPLGAWAGGIAGGALAGKVGVVSVALGASVGAVLGAAAVGYLGGKMFEESYGHHLRPFLDGLFERVGGAYQAAENFSVNAARAVGGFDGTWLKAIEAGGEDKAAITALLMSSFQVRVTDSLHADLVKVFSAGVSNEQLIGRDILIRSMFLFAKDNLYSVERVESNGVSLTLQLPNVPTHALIQLRTHIRDLLTPGDERGWSLEGPGRLIVALAAGTHAAGDAGAVLLGTTGVDGLLGGAGNDDAIGGGGADILLGAGGTDDLFGGEGNDLLDGGAGGDYLYGGAGFDTYQLTSSQLVDTILDADGSGTITVDGATLSGGFKTDTNRWISADNQWLYVLTANGDLVITRGSSLDQITIRNWQPNQLGITLSDAPAPTQPPVGTYYGDQRPGLTPQGTYDWNSVEWAPGGVLLGGEYEENFADVIRASAQRDRLFGFGGNDALIGLAGDDEIDGGEGDDLISGGAGSDVIRGGAGNDFIASAENVSVAQRLRPSDDWVPPAGATVVIEGATWGVYRLGGVLFWPRASPIAIDGAPDWVDAGAGNDFVIAGRGNDALSGGEGSDQMTGEAGHDVLEGGQGDDTLRGDVLFLGTIPLAQQGSDYLDGGDGNDNLAGSGNADWLWGGEGDDFLFGDDTTQLVAGSAHGSDYLDGEAGNDQLFGGGGADELFGGAGNDLLWGDDEQNRVAASFHGADYLDGEAGNDQLIGGGGDDELFGDEGNDLLLGDAPVISWGVDGNAHGNDYLDGENGDDLMAGYGGDDMLIGGAGNDQLRGDAPLEELPASFHGADWLEGGDGDDGLVGHGGDDVLQGGSGNDVLYGDALGNALPANSHGHDVLEGGEGNDLLVGGGGNDVLRGGEGADDLYGEAGDDVLEGGDGNDRLVGSTGRNDLRGGDGDDRLDFVGTGGTVDGGAGNDQIYDAGTGAAVFNFGRGSGLDGYASAGRTAPHALPNILELGADITAADLVARRMGTSLAVQVGETLDRFVIDGFFEQWNDGGVLRYRNAGDAVGNPVQQILLADGTPWAPESGDGLPLYFLAGRFIFQEGGAGDDVFDGRGIDPDWTSHFHGQGGQDTAHGTDEGDVFHGGDGHDRLFGHGGADTLYGDDGDDLLEGGEGSDHLQGDAGSNVLAGGAGSDRYWIAEGSSGHDTIVDSHASSAEVNTLVLEGVFSQDLTLVREWSEEDPAGLSVRVHFANAGGTVLLKDFLREPTADGVIHGVDRIEFINDAEPGLVWDLATIQAHIQVTDLVLTGTEGADFLRGDAGNDNLFGYGGDDTLHGAAGTDYLEGGAGSDTYLFARGDGEDALWDDDLGQGGIDVLQFLGNVTAEQIWISDAGGFLEVGITGAPDKVLSFGLEEIRAADGTLVPINVWGSMQSGGFGT